MRKIIFKTNKNTASQSGIMESEIILKNDVSLQCKKIRNMIILFAMLVKLCMLSNTVSSQENVELNKNVSKNKGLYFRLGAGNSYAFDVTSGINKLSPVIPEQTTNSTSYSNLNSGSSNSRTTKENIWISLGKGFQYGLGLGYKFNKNIGFELNGDFFSGVSNEIANKSYTSVTYPPAQGLYNPSSISSSTEYFKIYRKSIFIVPALKFMVPLNNRFSLYSKIGISIPFSNIAFYEYEKNTLQQSHTGSGSTESSSTEYKKIELEPYSSLGYSMSLGIDFSIIKRLSLCAEVYANAVKFEVKKGTITQWSNSSKDINGNYNSNYLLENLDTRDKVTEYQKNYSEDSNNPSTTNQNSPKKEPFFSLPSGSIGIAAGLIFNF